MKYYTKIGTVCRINKEILGVDEMGRDDNIITQLCDKLRSLGFEKEIVSEYIKLRINHIEIKRNKANKARYDK